MATFSAYLEAAKNHDLEKLKNYSFSLSPACLDETRKAECDNLMDSVYGFGSELERSDFKHSKFNDKGGIIYTDYAEEGEMRFVLVFMRENSELKISDIRYCLGKDTEKQCLEESYSF